MLAQKNQRLVRVFVAAIAIYCWSSIVLASEWRFKNVQRVVAVSDVHGAYDALTSTLQAAHVIDRKLAWNGGVTHFVLTGDLVDRGPDSRRVIDLMMRLEQEAIDAGGRVHVLLGNHEVMNLIGDIRYVSDAEYAAFSSEERPEEREFWFEHFRERQPSSVDEQAARWSFNKRAPLGFFAHRRAFSLGGKYATWLLEKPLMIVVNNTAYVHGGLPASVADKDLARLNQALKKDLVDYMTALSSLQRAGSLNPIDRFRDQDRIIAAQRNAGSLSPDMAETAQVILDLKESPLHGQDGPLWYRGSSECSAVVEQDVLSAALKNLGADRVVIGHTTTISRQVQSRLDGRIIEINTGMLKSSYQGSGFALIIDGDQLSVASQFGDAGLAPIESPRHVGERPDDLDDKALEDLLQRGHVVASVSSVTPRKLVKVRLDDHEVAAYFDPIPKKNNFAPELAAYRLDRMLGLDMVPVTIRRDVLGQRGTLQLALLGALTEIDRVGEEGRREGPCSSKRQQAAMRVYDALIGNYERKPQSMLYSGDGWKLILVEHKNSFGVETERSTIRDSSDTAMGPALRQALTDLRFDALKEQLSPALDNARLVALAKRRDRLLDRPYRASSLELGTNMSAVISVAGGSYRKR